MQIARTIELPSFARHPGCRRVMDALQARGADARFVGGAVRDTLAGLPAIDIDIATTSAAAENLKLLAKAGIKVIPTGLSHGTVTAISHRRSFEITTLRIDLESDGRHAVVVPTLDWAADAARRDFTINALYLDQTGQVYDNHDGCADLLAGRVRFIGDAEQRIREDYLRILRFFRLYARFGKGLPDADALAAVTRHLSGIERLAGERLQNEIRKLLLIPDPIRALKAMADCGALSQSLGRTTDVSPLGRLISAEKEARAKPNWLRRLAAICPGNADHLARRLRLSNAARDYLRRLESPASAPSIAMSLAELRSLIHRHGRIAPRDAALLQGRPDLARRLQCLQLPDFPLRGRDAVKIGLPAGPRMGQLLGEVESWWLAQGLLPDHTQCLEKLQTLMAGQ